MHQVPISRSIVLLIVIPFCRKKTIVARRRDSDFATAHCNNWKRTQQAFNVLSGAFAFEALQYLAQHEVSDDDSSCVEKSV